MLGSLLGSLAGNWIGNKVFGSSSSVPDFDSFENYSTDIGNVGDVGATSVAPFSSSYSSPLGSVLGSLGSSILSAFGIESSNARNERLMREQWNREDTAVQRRVADLRAAGLSPTLAAGGSASSASPVTMHSPLSSFADFGRTLLDAANLNKSLSLADSQIKSMAVNNALHEMQMDKVSAEISKLNKEIKYLGWLRVSQIGRNWSSTGRDINDIITDWVPAKGKAWKSVETWRYNRNGQPTTHRWERY